MKIYVIYDTLYEKLLCAVKTEEKAENKLAELNIKEKDNYSTRYTWEIIELEE